jgi:uroporphyrinogen decarboxylase
MAKKMTSKERWQNVIARKPVDRLPCDFAGTAEVIEQLCQEVNCGDYWQMIDKLDIDARYVIKTNYCGPTLKAGYNIWGVKMATVDYGSGTYEEAVEHPLAQAKTLTGIKEHPWPSVDWIDFSGVKEQIEQNRTRPIQAGYIEPFLCYGQMRGLEQALIDMIEAPDMIECAFDYMFEFATGVFEQILQETDGKIDITITAEDLGSQTAPLFSVDFFERFHKPRFKKYIELAKQANVAIFYHTDGAARPFIGGLIDMGVDILNPIQWRCPGMDRESLKRDFGDKLIFHGAIDNQQTLPFGTKEDVRKEILESFEILGTGGGYICAPCHNIQPITPIENILEMYQTIKEVASDNRFTKLVEV